MNTCRSRQRFLNEILFLVFQWLCISSIKVFLIVSIATAQSGVLIPSSIGKPDQKVLSLAVMNVDILIDNQYATVKVTQIFDNHTSNTLEGKYVFALPQRASIADFAVWDDVTRIPGVMMEKRRANEIYGQIKQRQTDPGILQTTDETESSTGFSAKIFPINAYGTKRLEMEYSEVLPVEDLSSHFSFPLKPSYGEVQSVGEFNLSIRVLSNFPISPALYEQSPYPLQISKAGPGEFTGEFHAANIELKDDFSFDYRIDANESALSVIAYRAPERISAYDLRDPRAATQNPDGYFQASAIFASARSQTKRPRRVVLLLDTSLSMYGDKLTRAVEAVDFFLHDLTPEDEFNLVLFNEDTLSYSIKPVSATAESVEGSLQFVKTSSLGGGTNLKKALETAVSQCAFFENGDPFIVLISDANPTLETTQIKALSSVFNSKKIKLFAFGLGNDTNTSLLKDLTERTRGFFDQARETEDIAAKLRLFFDKIQVTGMEGIRLDSSAEKNLYDIYPSGSGSYFGSDFSFVGRYRKAQTQTFDLSAKTGVETIRLSQETALPELDSTHAHLPRVWAKARIDALLQAMNRDGEREDLISEIIRLSEKYKLVTPYTAFLAAPRALLRPRLIQPGDPVIRVKTDPSVTAVFAVLPFGETLPLKFLAAEGVWEARFLAPAWMVDGTYKCRLMLTDKNGNGFQEEKSFVIDSRAPKVKIMLDKQSFAAGDDLPLKVLADSDTNLLTVRIYGAKPVQLRWSNQEKANIGRIQIPSDLASGKYTLTVSAEDFAHNQSTTEAQIEVIGN